MPLTQARGGADQGREPSGDEPSDGSSWSQTSEGSANDGTPAVGEQQGGTAGASGPNNMVSEVVRTLTSSREGGVLLHAKALTPADSRVRDSPCRGVASAESAVAIPVVAEPSPRHCSKLKAQPLQRLAPTALLILLAAEGKGFLHSRGLHTAPSRWEVRSAVLSDDRVVRPQLYAREKKKFGKADSDGVQGLNITEFLAFEHPEEFDYMQDSVLEEALLEHDKDGDGFVNLAEFLGDYHRDPTAESDPEWVITETDKFTSEFDIDHDGKLNPSELLSWLMPNNLEVAEDETEHLLEHMDTDGDGQLSHDEVVQNKELFLTSEVTDYGRQLGEQYAHHEEL
ncbi:45 kDa calcium-binding protein-like [Lethenteron reissneri]|uniref:45 kDa calcium-binding protein-like n=1 Tax=Lethenteron reissneri TaxID=7753 RepID=UPI002AB64EEA|nr:45 kDa calcium-binding protein-like [Lethenteron reissneri]